MDLVFAAKVWDYWLSFALLIPVLLVVVAIILGYVVKVVGPRYTRR
jgi:hypothetical protein